MTDVTNGQVEYGLELSAADEQLLRELTGRALGGGALLDLGVYPAQARQNASTTASGQGFRGRRDV
ncbi:MAG: hypothetical protein M3Y33_00245 [Actinomycetota bacterium]|nr:hypothetical protein [Actinomycetota bacterium]